MAQHTNYWSCSKFADWIRGTTKGGAKTSEGWHEWETRAKAAYPIRWWIAEEGLSHLQDFVTWPIRKLYDIKYYINNRWVTSTHALTAHPRDIKPGSWCDVGNRFLPCLFNSLVDFVEIELAWWHVVWDDKAYKQFHAPWYSRGWFRWRTWRSPEAGLANLEWQRKLIYDDEWIGADDPRYGKPTPQAVKAQEILDLYTWWTTTYRNRPDPHDASGWSAYCDAMRDKYPEQMLGGLNSKDPEDRKASDKAHKLLRKIEAQYEKEDEQMMIRLIKIRDGLWT
jgi:hypothetical protein